VIAPGVYLYRESCNADTTNCSKTPTDYGWEEWRDDFFKPSAPLFAAAPWIMVRGNHEICFRAGEGWLRRGIWARSLAREFYIVQDSTTKRCTIVEQRPTSQTTVVVEGGRTFTTRQETEGATKTVKVCESGGTVGGPVPPPPPR
jgi:hypothetical protein